MNKLGGIKGVFSPLVVPYNNDGSINYGEYTKITKHISDNGINGILVGGSTGEFANLTMEERKNLLLAAKEGAGEHCTIIYNCTALNMNELEQYTSWGLKQGIDGFTATSPYYHGYDETAMFRYFGSIAELCEGTPFYLYNIPSRTHNPISSTLVEKLIDKYANIKGIKDSSMDFMTLQEYMLVTKGRDFDVSTGNDMQIFPALKVGASGGVIALATVFPRAAAELYQYFLSGDMEKAQEIQDKFLIMCREIRNILPIMAQQMKQKN